MTVIQVSKNDFYNQNIKNILNVSNINEGKVQKKASKKSFQLSLKKKKSNIKSISLSEKQLKPFF